MRIPVTKEELRFNQFFRLFISIFVKVVIKISHLAIEHVKHTCSTTCVLLNFLGWECTAESVCISDSDEDLLIREDFDDDWNFDFAFICFGQKHVEKCSGSIDPRGFFNLVTSGEVYENILFLLFLLGSSHDLLFSLLCNL